MSLRAAAILTFFVACGGSGEPQTGATRLRVSATAGIADFEPGPQISGSTAAALDLVYDLPADHFSVVRVDGTSALVERLPSSPLSTQELAPKIRYRGLQSAEVVGDEQIKLQFADERTAHLFGTYLDAGIDTGPFRLVSSSDESVLLERRRGTGVEVIEIVASTRRDEWRRLMARELDVIPQAAFIYREQLEGIGTVRLLDIPTLYNVALYFNVRREALASVETRRRLVASLNREAIARVACGTPACAHEVPVTAGDEDAPLPEVLTMLIAKTDTAAQLAASVVRHQLGKLGIVLQLDLVAIDELVTRTARGDYDLTLGPLPARELGFPFFLSPSHARSPGTVTGFSHSDYDAAYERNDLDAAQAILDREVPVTPLFEQRAFAAVDARFCGDVTPSATSWRWMADLHPCEEEEP